MASLTHGFRLVLAKGLFRNFLLIGNHEHRYLCGRESRLRYELANLDFKISFLEKRFAAL